MNKLNTIELLTKLVSFDTTSRNSNLALITFIKDYLAALGVECTLIHNAEGTKANLFATLGPVDKSGIMLSGHTDVVPVDGQSWKTNPWEATPIDNQVYGRGTCDMKGFIAVCLAYAPKFLASGLKTPIHLAFSYDEEVGCIGVHSLLDMLNEMPIKPAMCIVGEPTNMDVSLGHKGKYSYTANITGHETHSSLAPEGVNAIEYGAELISFLKKMSVRFANEGPFDDAFDVTHTTVHTGTIKGGTALNIVPGHCTFEFEFRNLATHSPEIIFNEFKSFALETLEPQMKKIHPGSHIEIVQVNHAPGLSTDVNSDVVTFVKSLAGRNDHIKVAFATEAGLFDEHVGIPTVICGPGSIEQAHKPDEFISMDQITHCEQFMDRLIEKVS